MTGAIDRVRELRHDRRVEIDIIDLGRREERIDQRLNRARELLEYQMLILHFGAELRHLEQALAIPREIEAVDEGTERDGIIHVEPDRERRQRTERRQQPFIEEG